MAAVTAQAHAGGSETQAAGGSPAPGVVGEFHPAVRAWFESRFPQGPTAAQAGGWPSVMTGSDTLIAAPTGSGKTLAGFLACIDRLYRAAASGEQVEGKTQVVYVSPLKALAVDIQHNLERPLREIAETARQLGLPAPELRVEVRNGDTPASTRVSMVRRPPSFLVTTPESLYLMVTAERSRETLREVSTVIVDEIHAVARDKRGAHLAVTLERLEAICGARPSRIGLSATQRPIETIARLLVGSGPGRSDDGGRPRCEIVDVGHRRRLDVAIELMGSEIAAVASQEQVGEVLDRVAELVREHRTTIVFVNTRRTAERIAHLLGERLGEEGVASHHGSLSKERRLRVESQLRAGELRALVATASLELGIDIGPVDLVCQIGSPRSIATFLQRVGRSGHSRQGTPKGRLFPLTRDELIECCALLAAVRSGRLDSVLPPVAPLDILAQQIVAECAARSWKEDELFEVVRRAAPFADLAREDFDDVVQLVAEGVRTGRGTRGAYVHRDGVNGQLKGRRGARLAALTSGGAIPETGDYRVVTEPDETLVGTVNEDWAIESMAGDVFLLGSTSWRIRRVEPGTVRVVDAEGAPPTVPFWLGEAPARTRELSEEVSALRQGVDARLAAGSEADAREWVTEHCAVSAEVADMVVRYLAAGRVALGGLPTMGNLVVERFFDDSGGMQLVVHSPFGGRVNRGFGLALRKRFCVSFDFELQAAATDDGVLLSLGPQHSFEVSSVPRFLSSRTVGQTLSQAVLTSPMFAARWRWNLNRSLTVLRYRGGRRNPPPIQRMEADDLMAAVFPALAACQENATGPVEVPDHPLVSQTMRDCLHEAMDLDGLEALVASMESGQVTVTCLDTTEPSPLSHEILNARPYAFLDDAPLEERRSRAVSLRRGLPVEASDLGRLDPEAIARVRDEARPDPRDADEVHDLLLSLVLCRPDPAWSSWFDELSRAGRAREAHVGGAALWCATERCDLVASLLPGDAAGAAAVGTAAAGAAAVGTAAADAAGAAAADVNEGSAVDPGEAAAEALRGHLDVLGPTPPEVLVERTGLSPATVAIALARLENEGFALRGSFDPALPGEQWCARRLLARIHSYTKGRLRREIEPVGAQDFMRFLLAWQGVSEDSRRYGRSGLGSVIGQLQGFELPVGAWERDVLAVRVAGYHHEWLDQLCLGGEVAWARLRVREERDGASPGSRASPTSASTPVTLVLRDDLAWLLQAARGAARPAEPSAGATRDVLDALGERGALFVGDLVSAARRLPSEVEDALWDAVSRGLVTSDGFAAVRALLAGRQAPGRSGTLRAGSGGRGRPRPGSRGRSRVGGGGRWALLPGAAAVEDADELAEAAAGQLLSRWGVVFYDLMARESLALPWREILWALRRMEARGTVRGGRFVAGFAGEQYALPDAVERLRALRRRPRTGEVVRLCAADPLNLVGIVTPGARVPALRTNMVAYRDGAPVEPSTDASGAAAARAGAPAAARRALVPG